MLDWDMQEENICSRTIWCILAKYMIYIYNWDFSQIHSKYVHETHPKYVTCYPKYSIS